MNVLPSPIVCALERYAPTRHGAPVDLRLDGFDSAPAQTQQYPDDSELTVLAATRFGVLPEQVAVTAGVDDGLDRACRSLLCPGRELILARPTFEMLPRYARLAGATVREVTWSEGRFPLEATLAEIGPATAAIAVVTPNNPTGAVASAADLRELSKRAPQAALLVDLAYGEFADIDLSEVALSLPNAIVFRTMSKAWALPGLRVGFALGPAPMIEWLRRTGNPYAVSAPSLVSAAAALRTAGADMRTRVRVVRSERDALQARLVRLGVNALPSQANFVLAKTPVAHWLRDGLAGAGIAVRGWPDGALADALRITCPGDDASFVRLGHAIENVLSPQALLFDMDGVLVDVSGSYRRAIIDTAQDFGVAVCDSEVDRAKAAGDANNDWLLTQRLMADRGVERPLAQVVERFEAHYAQLRRCESLLVSPALLEAFARKLPLAIVTGRPRAQAEAALAEYGIEELFTALVCMEDAPAKPDPAAVRLALSQLGVERAWMVGDTPDDVHAAQAAGVVPLGFSNDALTQSGAARSLESFQSLLNLLEALPS